MKLLGERISIPAPSSENGITGYIEGAGQSMLKIALSKIQRMIFMGEQ